MRILFFRHGDPNYEIDNLTDKGKVEAALLADTIKNFGITCVMLSRLWNVSPFVPLQMLAMAPTSVTEAVTEEREKGIAIFRTLRAGDITHLTLGKEKPSFSARYCERFENEKERH